MKAPKEKKREGPNQRIQIQLALHNEMDAFVSAGAHTAGKTVPKIEMPPTADLSAFVGGTATAPHKRRQARRVFITAT